MGLCNSVLLLLIQGDEGRPDWLPAALFSVDVESVPADWQFALVDARAAGGADEPDGWQAIWGYPELVRDAGHSDALIERDVAALRIFYARRAAALEADPG